MLNLPITEGELTFLAKFVNCAPILLCGRIAHTAWVQIMGHRNRKTQCKKQKRKIFAQ